MEDDHHHHHNRDAPNHALINRPRAADLQRELRERNKKRMECFDEVLVKLYSAISAKAALNWTRMIYEIPRFVLGMPFYDIEPCVRYVAKKLQGDGYLVEVYLPNIMYVSWDRGESRDRINNHRQGPSSFGGGSSVFRL